MVLMGVRRVGWVCALLALLPLTGSCGSGDGNDGGHSGEFALLGGTLPPDPDAYRLTPTIDPSFAPSLTLLPAVNLHADGLIPPVQNQRWNSCVAWTLAYYVMTAVEARVSSQCLGIDVDVGDSRNWFAPDFIYSQRDQLETRQRLAPDEAICLETDGELGCMRPERALEILVRHGCCKWSWMCQGAGTSEYRPCAPDAQDLVSQQSRRRYQPAMPGAERFKPSCYVRFGELENLCECTIEEMQAWLFAQRTPIAVVVQMMEGWVTYRGENPARVKTNVVDDSAFETRSVCLDAVGANDLGSQHMMTIVGYDNNYPNETQYPGLAPEKRGSFLVVNQWGTKWGDQGFMWIPYAELEKIWIGAYGVIGRDACETSPRRDIDTIECVQDETGAWVQLVEPDDVPFNRPDAVDAPPQPVVRTQTGDVVTAQPLPAFPEGDDAPTNGEVGGLVDGSRDVADWWWFRWDGALGENCIIQLEWDDDADPGGPGAFELNSLELKLVDENQELVAVTSNTTPRVTVSLPVTIPQDAARSIVLTGLCPGSLYFVKVFPRGLLRRDVRYQIGLTIGNDDQGTDRDPFPEGGICNPLGLDLVDGINQSAETVIASASLGQWWEIFVPTRSFLQLSLTGPAAGALSAQVWQGPTPYTASLVGPLGPAGVLARPGEFLYVFVEPPEGPTPVPYRLEVTASAANDDTPESATPVVLQSLGATVSGSVSAGDQRDHYRIDVPFDARIRATLSDVANGAQVQLSILQDQEVDGVGALATQTLVSPGGVVSVDRFPDFRREAVVIAVGACPDGDTCANTSYTLRIEVEPFDDEGDGPSPGTSPVLRAAPGRAEPRDAEVYLRLRAAPVVATVGGDDEADFYTVAYTKDSGSVEQFVLTLTGFAPSDSPTLEIAGPADDDPEVVLTGPRQVNGATVYDLAIDDTELDVFVAVRANGAPTTAYRLRMMNKPAPTPTGDGNETPPHATETRTIPRTDSIGPDDPRDFFRIPLISAGPSGQLTVEVDNPLLRVHVWDEAGNVFTHDEAGPPVVAVTVGASRSLLVLVDWAETPSQEQPYTLHIR